ncbi:MAG: hypothetical protein LBD02_11055 [Christensenellaceae bacterium]|nr:hypothetical protein [Christensenellaceae bacterium]
MRKRPFGALIEGAFRLYGRGFTKSLPLLLLYYCLPLLCVFFMATMMLKPLFGLYAALFRSLLSGSPLESGMAGIGQDFLPGMAQTFLWMPLYLLVCLGYGFLIQPLFSARMAAINSAAYQNAPIGGFSVQFHLMDGRRSKPIVQSLILMGFGMAVGTGFALLLYGMFFGSIFGIVASPVWGAVYMVVQSAALYLAYCAALFILAALQVYAPLVGMNENLWAFDGLKRAFLLFKTRPWAFIGGSSLLGLMVLAAICLLALACALCGAPFWAYPLAFAIPAFLAVPLEYAFYAQLYFDRAEAAS